MSEFTHIDEAGRVRMVDVTDKTPTDRTATAMGQISMLRETFDLIKDHKVAKGNVLEAARIAGVMAAKNTWNIIPMCHPLNLTHVQVDFYPDEANSSIEIQASARVKDNTGIEMEALTAVAAAALTIYDMCKAYDKAMVISNIQLLKKTGGKSGIYERSATVR